MEHFVKQSHRYIWHFLHSAKSGICFARMRDERLGRYEVLLPDGEPDFAVTVDDEDVLHLICQDRESSIIYLNYSDGDWHKHVLLKSKTPRAYRKGFQIACINSWVNLFYVIEYQEKRMLTHHILHEETPPTIVDQIEQEFSMAVDSLDNIYLFYENAAGAFGYRMFAWNKKEWGDFRELQTDIANIYPFFDGKNRLHLVGTSGGEVVHVLEGRVRKLGEGTAPILLEREQNLWAVWIVNDNACSSVSRNYGDEWQLNNRFMAGRTVPASMYSLSFATPEESQLAPHCYGYCGEHSAHLYVLSDFFDIRPFRAPPREKIEGEDVENFARRFQGKPDVEGDASSSAAAIDVEMEKIKIAVMNVSEQVVRMDKKLDEIKSGINAIFERFPKEGAADG